MVRPIRIRIRMTAVVVALGIGAVAAGGAFAGDSGAKAAGAQASASAQTLQAGETARIGAKAPGFALTDTEGRTHELAKYLKDGKVVVLEWFNPDCPFVQKHHARNKTMAELAGKYGEKGIVWLAVNSGARGKQGAGLERNKTAKKDFAMAYPILLDESGEVGRAYGAKTTPHMYVITSDGILRYAGAIDDAPNTSDLGKTNYVRQALDSVVDGKQVAVTETKAYGCSVKYSG